MKDELRQFILTTGPLVLIILMSACEYDIDLFPNERDTYPKGTVVVTVLDSFDNPMKNRKVSLSGAMGLIQESKNTGDEGQVVFGNVPRSHGVIEAGLFQPFDIPAGPFYYNIGVDYHTDDCCYSLIKNEVTFAATTNYISMKIPDDLVKISGHTDVANPDNSCTCDE